MAKFAVVKLGAKQYVIEEGKEYKVPKFSVGSGNHKVAEVLAVGDEKQVKLGNPNVEGAEVTINVKGHEKGEKVRTAVYKAKSRYRRVHGHRKQLTSFEVVKINF
ncbi:MAG: hypothetical protein KatS3mg085_765 [Candidatus Dojkabacteria bacterium]|nr:MAG: hypothetical protein KatS3mg085_765 [Candidatus Dojkabacteria bacterium]